MYTTDLELVQKMYMKDRRDPPLPRDLPPISGDVFYCLWQFHYIYYHTGRIAWARQLYRRIAAPMDVFQQFDALLKSPDAIKVIKGYNRMARVLVEYEVLHHQAWTQQVCHPVLESMSFCTPGGRETMVVIDSQGHI